MEIGMEIGGGSCTSTAAVSSSFRVMMMTMTTMTTIYESKLNLVFLNFVFGVEEENVPGGGSNFD